MIDLGRGYDSANRDFCDRCSDPIDWPGDKIIIGTGNELASVFHPDCFEEICESTSRQ